MIDLLKNYFRIGDRESPREIREKVTGRVLMLDRALEATIPALLVLLECRWMIRSGRPSTRPNAGSARSTRSSACSCVRLRSSRSWWS